MPTGDDPTHTGGGGNGGHRGGGDNGGGGHGGGGNHGGDRGGGHHDGENDPDHHHRDHRHDGHDGDRDHDRHRHHHSHDDTTIYESNNQNNSTNSAARSADECDRGYGDGLYTGANDAQRGQSYDPQSSHFYKRGGGGSLFSIGRSGAARQDYRECFLRGYEEGFRNYQTHFSGGVFHR
ncbi:MAG: hypothetical protein ACJ74Q_11565 [Pyrinomonadaceae bacterium]